jgi:hypothetical protein
MLSFPDFAKDIAEAGLTEAIFPITAHPKKSMTPIQESRKPRAAYSRVKTSQNTRA